MDCTIHVEDFRDLTCVVERTRRLFDLDADPVAVDSVLRVDPVLRGGVDARPGIRVPGHVDGDEVALRAVLGQQVSVAAATRLATILADRYGETCAPDATLTRYFPTAAALSTIDPNELPMPRARGLTFVTLAKALADGTVRLDAGADRGEAARSLGAIKGIGPWTTSYVQMRALGDPDSFLPGDLALRRSLDRCGLPSDERAATTHAEAWRPYRSYAMLHLWALDSDHRAASTIPKKPTRTGANR
jgi:AraC family transcriptional regulator of adaptative response / DNA-3-methyladenine glycosylase II